MSVSADSELFGASGRRKRVVVVGAGITGLSAAFKLSELLSGKNAEIKVFEANASAGGTIKTRLIEGCLLEDGPDSFITAKSGAIDLCERLGLIDELFNTNPQSRRTLVVSGGRLHPLPEGFMLMAPSRVWPVVSSPLFSLTGKLRMTMELLVPPLSDDRDESLAEFVTRRLGAEVLEKVAQPMICGIYGADPRQLSLKSTMPRFQEMERKYGSVIRGLLCMPAPAGDSGARYSMFATLKDGLGSLIRSIEARLPPGSIVLSRAVKDVFRDLESGSFRVVLDNDDSVRADAVIVATPAENASKLVFSIDRRLSGWLSSIRFASSAVLNLIYRQHDISNRMDGFGFVVPDSENLCFNACTFTSVKFPHRASPGLVSVRLFLGGMLHKHILDCDDQFLISRAVSELGKLIRATGEPLYRELVRHPRRMPQYDVGHLGLLERVERRVAALPGLEIAGSSYHGVGIPDCVASGEKAAAGVYGYLCDMAPSSGGSRLEYASL